MARGAEFLLSLIAPTSPGFIDADDLAGPHAAAIRLWQEAGFVAAEAGAHPVPSCPRCGEGVPYRLGRRHVCDACRSDVDPTHLCAWAVRTEALLVRVADHLQLRGGVGEVDGGLWRLGTGSGRGGAVECFCHAGGRLTDAGARRLAGYVRVLVLHGPAAESVGSPGRWVPLVEVFGEDGSLRACELSDLLGVRGRVRFDPGTGSLRVGGALAGEVPIGGREFALLECLAENLDRYVPYADLKREVLRRTGGSGGAEEATFCQKIKSRVKEKYVPGIDRLVATSNKGDGYRLRGEAEL